MPGGCLGSFQNHHLKVWLWQSWRSSSLSSPGGDNSEVNTKAVTGRRPTCVRRLTYFLFSHHNPLIYAHSCARLTGTKADATYVKPQNQPEPERPKMGTVNCPEPVPAWPWGQRLHRRAPKCLKVAFAPYHARTSTQRWDLHIESHN